MAEQQHRYEEGLIVEHPRKPEWGPGRILAVRGTRITVYFRDIRGDGPEDAVRTIDIKVVPLDLAAMQTDPILDNLPPYRDGGFAHPPAKRVTWDEGMQKFHSLFPLYFDDPLFLGNGERGERNYKWAAHELFASTLGNGRLAELVRNGNAAELRKRIVAVEGKVNLLAVFEKAAFRDALRPDDAVLRYAGALDALLKGSGVRRDAFEAYIEAIEALPSTVGKTDPAKWTVATVLPYLAAPDRFMFLKPQVTQDCAARLTFDLRYSPQLNWVTYERLLAMSAGMLQRLRPYGARDFIDVQSFIWVIGGGWD